MPGDFQPIPNNYLPCPNLPSISGPGLGAVPHDRRVSGSLSGAWDLSPRCVAPPEVPHLVVAAGSQFVGQMTFINLDEGELSLLALALGLDGTFCPRFGGGKYHGLGRMQVTITSCAMRRGRGPIQHLQGDALAEHLAAWLDLFLQCMSTSSLATRSRSARLQAQVLGWTHKRLAEHDKQNQGRAHRVGAARRG